MNVHERAGSICREYVSAQDSRAASFFLRRDEHSSPARSKRRIISFARRLSKIQFSVSPSLLLLHLRLQMSKRRTEGENPAHRVRQKT